jgi:molybdenum cofactor cytidylyltransferase
MIGAVVLAAGESKRMGVPKLLLPYRGATIIEAVLDAVTASGADVTLVVLGANRAAIRKRIRRFSASVAVNTRFREGMLTSIQTGISALPGRCRAALVVLGDQPDLPPSVIDALIAAWKEGRQGIVVPVFGGRRGHPLLLDLKHRREIDSLTAETGLRGLLAAHPEDILEVDVPDGAVLADIDTPDDYRKAVGQPSGRSNTN